MKTTRRHRWVLVGLSLLLIGTVAFFLYYLSGFLIYGGRLPQHYYRPMEPVCNNWLAEKVFGDNRTDAEKQTSSIRLRSCAESFEIPRETLLVTTQEGLRVRLVVPDGLEARSDLPIWLHIHGITDSYLNGMRFYDASHRLGFKLIMLELQNHGGSDRHEQGSSWGCRERWDLIAALETIRERYPRSEVLITATSMGTITTSEALLTKPESFAAVRGVIYESPLASFNSILDRICHRWPHRGFCRGLWEGLVFGLSHWRTDVDLMNCHQPDTLSTAMPTLLWLTEEEYPDPAFRDTSVLFPRHSEIQKTVFTRGSHSAYYGYQPEAIEEDIRRFWTSVPRNPPRPEPVP